jgi:hypothetical protein
MLGLGREDLRGDPAAESKERRVGFLVLHEYTSTFFAPSAVKSKKPRLQTGNRGLDKTWTRANRYTPGMVQMSFFIIFHSPVLRSNWQFTKHFQFASSIFGLSALK